MTYSVDLRKKVVSMVEHGGSEAEAARRFDISLWCVRDWLARQDLQPRQQGVARRRKLDKEALRAHVRDYPDALVRERAAHFGVYPNAVWVALKGLKLTHKKDTEVQRARPRTTDGLLAKATRHHCRTRLSEYR